MAYYKIKKKLKGSFVLLLVVLFIFCFNTFCFASNEIKTETVDTTYASLLIEQEKQIQRSFVLYSINQYINKDSSNSSWSSLKSSFWDKIGMNCFFYISKLDEYQSDVTFHVSFFSKSYNSADVSTRYTNYILNNTNYSVEEVQYPKVLDNLAEPFWIKFYPSMQVAPEFGYLDNNDYIPKSAISNFTLPDSSNRVDNSAIIDNSILDFYNKVYLDNSGSLNLDEIVGILQDIKGSTDMAHSDIIAILQDIQKTLEKQNQPDYSNKIDDIKSSITTTNDNINKTNDKLNSVNDNISKTNDKLNTVDNSIKDVHNTITDDKLDIDNSISNLPKDDTSDPTQDFFSNLFNMYVDAFINNEEKPVVLTVPFTEKSFVISSDTVYPKNSEQFDKLKSFIQIFWYFVVCAFIIRDVSDKVETIKQGDAEYVAKENKRKSIVEAMMP